MEGNSMADKDNTSKRGLGSPKMSAAKKKEIQSRGGKASRGGGGSTSS